MMAAGVKRALLLLLLIPVAAWAGTEAQDGQSTRQQLATPIMGGIVRADTTVKTFTMTSDGFLRIAEASPSYTDFRDGATAIIDDTTAVGMADSSAVINMGKYRVMALAFKVDPAGGGSATPFARLAVTIRYHLNQQSDSASVFPLLAKPLYGAGLDSLTWRTTVAPTSVVASDREVVVTVQRDDLTSSKWGQWGTGVIQLADVLGRDLWAPYISVRVRQIGGSGICRQKWYLLATPN